MIDAPPEASPTPTLGRRALLGAGALGLLALALGPRRARAESLAPRRLKLRSPHTGEHVDVIYSEGGRLLPDALAELDRFLRDFRSGDVHPIDPGALDIAWTLARAVDRPAATFEVISGYRSPATNRILHERSAGVAVHSLHMEGRALDLRLPGVETSHLAGAALALRRGGVGFYPQADFVHVDTGRVRSW